MHTETLLCTTGSMKVLMPGFVPDEVANERRKAPRPERVQGWQLGAWPATSPGPVCGYRVEADPEGRFAICRMLSAPKDRVELAGRMRELVTFMRLQGYDGAVVDMRTSRLDASGERLAVEMRLPYAINPLWRLALLAPRVAAPAQSEMIDALLKAHQRAGVRMHRFEAYGRAAAWLKQGEAALR